MGGMMGGSDPDSAITREMYMDRDEPPLGVRK